MRPIRDSTDGHATTVLKFHKHLIQAVPARSDLSDAHMPTPGAKQHSHSPSRASGWSCTCSSTGTLQRVSSAPSRLLWRPTSAALDLEQHTLLHSGRQVLSGSTIGPAQVPYQATLVLAEQGPVRSWLGTCSTTAWRRTPVLAARVVQQSRPHAILLVSVWWLSNPRAMPRDGIVKLTDEFVMLTIRRTRDPPNRLSQCLQRKRVVVLGDSSVAELMVEFALLLARRSTDFTAQILDLEWKFQGKRHTVVQADDLRADFWPHQRNWTFSDMRTNMTLQFLHSGGPDLTDHVGMATLTDPAFEGELRRLGVHQDSSASERPDIAVFSTTFHDDFRLSSGKGCNPTNCTCSSANSWPWSHAFQGFVNASSRAAELMATVASSGVRTCYLTLFPRHRHWRADVLRALAEATMYAELQRSGYFRHGGRFVDVWPVAAAYFRLSGLKQYSAGPSSLHYSPLSNKDHYVQPDFSAMRLQWLLNGICSPDRAVHRSAVGATTSSPPSDQVVGLAGSICGVGSLFFPQVQRDSGPTTFFHLPLPT